MRGKVMNKGIGLWGKREAEKVNRLTRIYIDEVGGGEGEG